MKRVMIIDDSEFVLKAVKKMLEMAGYDVLTLEHPGGFDPASEKPPDLVLVDINMPEFYGDDVVAYFKEDEWGLSSPFLLYSNLPEYELAERAKACGANGYISKDWGLEGLLSAVKNILPP